ncbi:TRAP transporter small permease [uncultured Clostridium sp.]|uniref:TRAP transporter small permease n=1 Tax=uncultured Clostridium sp. TaxID=59620 RepID=UPI002600E59F|nr:TRAP transporter small permease [uncultured Clostridium sp.]
MKLIRKLDQSLEEWILGALLIGMAVILLIQILMRAVVGNSLTWAEEVARYFYVWSVFLSLGCTIRNGTVLRVDLLLELLPKRLRQLIEILLDLINVVLYAGLAYFSVSVMQKVQISGQTSPALEIPMYLVYAIIPIGFVMASLRSVQKIYFDATGKKNTVPADPAEAQ